MSNLDSRTRWLALIVLCLGDLMIVLDTTIVNVALPSIRADLGFTEASLAWVVNAYLLTFGGFLLLGGRLGDLYGHRRMFLIGIALFTVASIACGAANGEAMLVTARAVQGVGGAVVSAVALSLMMNLFTEPAERAKAMGVFGFVMSGGGSVGVLLGGILTDLLSWPWIFFVNVPVGVAAFAVAPLLLAESRDARGQSFDLPGAALVTSGLVLLVYALTQANGNGWGSAKTLALFAAALALLVSFVRWESRTRDPLLPLSIFRLRALVGANLAGVVLGTIIFSMFLMLTLYMQQVLGYSPLRTGVGYLAVAGSAILWSAVAAKLVTRVGVKPVLVAGMTFLAAGLTYFTQVSVGGSYLGDLLPGFLLIAIGMGFSFVPISIAALAGVQPSEAGLASGLINTSQQVGGALGIAALSAIATSTTSSDVAGGAAQAYALTDGFQAAFVVAAGAALAGLLIATVLLRRRDLAQTPVAAQPAFDAA